jgi:hypothetical protein
VYGCNSPVLSVSSSGLLVVAAVSLPSPGASAKPASVSVFSTSGCLVFYGKRGGERGEEEEGGGVGGVVLKSGMARSPYT